MTAAQVSKSMAVRAHLGHPVIDFDAHTVEVEPAFLDCLRQVAGPAVRDRFVRRQRGGAWRRWYRMSWDERRQHRAMRPPWWRVPTSDALDQATFMFPKLRRERMEELGTDFAIVYPTAGLSYPHLPDEELRLACCRAYNILQAEAFRDHLDCLAPAAVIPMHTPREAAAELEAAVKGLGMKCVMLAGQVTRPIEAVAAACPEAKQRATWLDTLGLDSEYDYDPVWAKCEELKVAPTFHSAGMGWGSRVSISNYVYNHIGHFAAAGEAVCKSLVLGGVVRRFPNLRFTFLEGGVGWACSLYAGLIGHWSKRHRGVIDSLNPARLDAERLADLARRYGGVLAEGMSEPPPAGPRRGAAEREDLELSDEWAACGVESAEDIRDLFGRSLYFGCEADDPLNALAFDTRLNPLGARLNAVFSSDIGHWDVPDITAVVAEAYELVEKGLLTESDFRDFVYVNAVTLLTDVNPDFFKGTTVETQVSRLLAERRQGDLQLHTAD